MRPENPRTPRNGGAAWTPVTNVGGDGLRIIQPIDDDNLVACGSYTFIASVDGGDTRQERYTYFNYLRSITFINNDHGWVVGDEGHILATDDSGATWTEQTSGVGVNLFEVHFWDPVRGFAVGQAGTIVATDDGGATWQEIAGPTDATLYTISVLGLDQRWIGGAWGTVLALPSYIFSDGFESGDTSGWCRHLFDPDRDRAAYSWNPHGGLLSATERNESWCGMWPPPIWHGPCIAVGRQSTFEQKGVCDGSRTARRARGLPVSPSGTDHGDQRRGRGREVQGG